MIVRIQRHQMMMRKVFWIQSYPKQAKTRYHHLLRLALWTVPRTQSNRNFVQNRMYILSRYRNMRLL